MIETGGSELINKKDKELVESEIKDAVAAIKENSGGTKISHEIETVTGGTVTGTVEMTDKGIIISADDGSTYIIKGNDLSKIVGKSMKATGTLAEGESAKTLTVISVEPIPE